MTAMALWWALPAALAYAGLYRAADHPVRRALRLAGAGSLALFALALLTRS